MAQHLSSGAGQEDGSAADVLQFAEDDVDRSRKVFEGVEQGEPHLLGGDVHLFCESELDVRVHLCANEKWASAAEDVWR